MKRVMEMPPYLCKGKFVFLREMSEGDAATVVSCRNHPEVARWLLQCTPLTLEQHLSWFRAHRRSDALFVFDLPDGTPVGMASVCEFDRSRTVAEFGRLCSVARARYAFPILEGCYLVHRLAFELLGLKKLYSNAEVGNAPSRRLSPWLGYTQEGLRRQHRWTPDGYQDVLEFGLLAAEFAEKQHTMEEFLYKDDPSPTWTEAAVEFADLRRCP